MPRYRPSLNRGFGTVLQHWADANFGTYTWRIKAVKTDFTTVASNVTNFSVSTGSMWTVSLPNITYNATLGTILVASTGANGTIGGIEITIQKTANNGGFAEYGELVFARGSFSPSFDFANGYTLEVTSLTLSFYSGDPTT